MKAYVVAAIVAAMPLAAWSQSTSEGTSDSATVTISKSDRQLTQQDYRMLPREFAEFKGTYQLSDGNTLFLFSRMAGSHMYAKVQDQPEHEIMATAANSFVALDRQLRMRIDLQADGQASGELLMRVNPASASIAPGAEQYIALALR
jgi:hypothetical protein